MVTVSLLVYAGVKSYSLKGKLLTKKDFEMLAESRDLDELVTRIKNTAYNEVVSKIQRPYTAQKIELALKDRQADLHHMMIQAVGGSNLLFAYYLKFVLRKLRVFMQYFLRHGYHTDIVKYRSKPETFNPIIGQS